MMLQRSTLYEQLNVFGEPDERQVASPAWPAPALRVLEGTLAAILLRGQ
jgi:hypothetical protein